MVGGGGGGVVLGAPWWEREKGLQCLIQEVGEGASDLVLLGRGEGAPSRCRVSPPGTARVRRRKS